MNTYQIKAYRGEEACTIFKTKDEKMAEQKFETFVHLMEDTLVERLEGELLTEEGKLVNYFNVKTWNRSEEN